MGSVRDREGGGSTLSCRHCLVSCGVGKGQGGRRVHVRSTLSCRNPFSLIVTTRLTALPTIGPCPSTHSRCQSILQAFSLSFFHLFFCFVFSGGGGGGQTGNCARSL